MCAPARRPDGGSNDRVGALRSRPAPEGDREQLALRFLMLSAIANLQPATVAAAGWQFVFVSLAIVILLLEIIHDWAWLCWNSSGRISSRSATANAGSAREPCRTAEWACTNSTRIDSLALAQSTHGDTRGDEGFARKR